MSEITKRAFASSLKKMLAKRPLEKIRVIDITEDCGVNRQTFYYHFHDIPEVVECHFTTGQYDMFIKLYAKDNRHLLNIIHGKLQSLGLSRTESLISFKEVFKRQLPIIPETDE